ATFSQIVDGELCDLGIFVLVVIDEIMEVRALVRIYAAYRLAHSAVEGAVGFGIDPIRCYLGTMMEGRDNEAAALLLGERDIGLRRRRRLAVAAHKQIEAIGRAVRHTAEPDLFARNEPLQHLQCEIMRSEEEGY